MADQTTLKGSRGSMANGASVRGSTTDGKGLRSDSSSRANPPEARESGMVDHVTGFGENLLTLAELQARLTAIEFRQNIALAKTGGALLVAGGLLAICSVPVVIAGVAEVLISELGMRRGP